MNDKSVRFEMRLNTNTINRLDAWRHNQSDVPSRSEAVRRLMEVGFNQSDSNNIQISDAEKLIIFSLKEIHEELSIKGEMDLGFVSRAILDGHNWALDMEYPSLMYKHKEEYEEMMEVCDILQMWTFIEWAIKELPKKEKTALIGETEETLEDFKFVGFDGSNESQHFGIAQFLIHTMGRFKEFIEHDMNSHMQMLHIYRRMLQTFVPIRQKLMGRKLNLEELIKLMESRNFNS